MSLSRASSRASWLPHEPRGAVRSDVAGPVQRSTSHDVDSWAAHISRVFVPLTPEPIGDEDFSASLSRLPRGPIELFRIEGAAQRVHRGRREIARSTSDVVFLNIQLTGMGDVQSGGGLRRTAPGEGALVQAEQTFELSFAGDFTQLCVAMPARWLAERQSLPLGVLSTRSLDLLSGAGRVVKASLATLIELPDGPEASAAADLFAATLDHALRGGGATLAPEGQASPRGAALRRLILRRLGDETFSPAQAASELGCSIRSVHAAAQTLGQSFGQLLLEARLTAAANALAGRTADRGRVSAVAFACGFGDLSHFSRTFRQRFGVAPGAWRG